jgi:adenosylcobyric acid synthase
VTNAAVEGTGDADVVPGLGLLPVETRFSTEKRVVATTLDLVAPVEGPLAGADGTVSGYEIHQGRTRATGPVETPFAPVDGDPTAALGAADGRVVGTYLHGLFETDAVRDAFLGSLFEAKGETWQGAAETGTTPYDRAAALVARMDVDPLLRAVGVDAGGGERDAG